MLLWFQGGDRVRVDQHGVCCYGNDACCYGFREVTGYVLISTVCVAMVMTRVAMVSGR